MNDIKIPYWVLEFDSAIGWFALLGKNDRLAELTFGHKSASMARKALSQDLLNEAEPLEGDISLKQRLQDYADGSSADSFLDVNLDLGHLGTFQRRVIKFCRQITFGSTISYGELAAKAGYPKAGRAVGTVMANNRIPIIIPCHRVVLASGKLGSYSAPGCVSMKKRLLTIEKASTNIYFSGKKLA